MFSLLGPLSIYLGLVSYTGPQVKKYAPADTQYLKISFLNYHYFTYLDLVYVSDDLLILLLFWSVFAQPSQCKIM